jgi:hypothetical protein
MAGPRAARCYLSETEAKPARESPTPPNRRGLARSRWPHLLAAAGDLVRSEPVADRLTAAKLALSCVPSQNGLLLEWPQRQRAIGPSTS